MKVLVSDFDHTFFNLKFEENIEAINNFVNRGNVFIIATGRNYSLLKEEIEYYDIKYSFLICKDGGVIFDRTGREIYRKNIDIDIAKKIYKFLNKSRGVPEVLLDTGVEFTSNVETPSISIIAKYVDHEKGEIILDKIKNEFPEIDGYLSETWINILDKEVSKGNAINKLISALNISKDAVYTIGDGINDVSMNSMFKGYAMPDSVDELKKVSIETVSSFKSFVDSL
ncbi:MAG TPA: HAD-IIB family hydrolase [Tenericutes bacterium]|nr:HAD-IIB family hydrolase [Mycoplasmatota bacterium]